MGIYLVNKIFYSLSVLIHICSFLKFYLKCKLLYVTLGVINLISTSNLVTVDLYLRLHLFSIDFAINLTSSYYFMQFFEGSCYSKWYRLNPDQVDHVEDDSLVLLCVLHREVEPKSEKMRLSNVLQFKPLPVCCDVGKVFFLLLMYSQT